MLKVLINPTDQAYQKLIRGEITERQYQAEVKKSRRRVQRTGSPYTQKEVEVAEPAADDHAAG